MLKGISSILSPQLLKVLCEMGHGDEIVIGDANFPCESIAKENQIIRADGLGAVELLEAILPLFPLDKYEEDYFILMKTEKGDPENPDIWKDLIKAMDKNEKDCHATYMERFEYYERAKKAFAVIASGEKAQYANVILKKGVVKEQ